MDLDLITCTRCKVSKLASQYTSYQLSSTLQIKKGGRTYTRKPISQCIQCVKERDLQRKYGISMEEFTTMQVEQKGLCKMGCGKIGSHVDHSHSSGRVRGLLCSNCNTGLGLFNDNPELLRNAAEYVEKEGFIISG